MAAFITAAEAFTEVSEEKEDDDPPPVLATAATLAIAVIAVVAEQEDDDDPPPVVAETVVAHKNLHIGRSWILSGAHSCHQFTIRIPAVFGD